LLQHSLLRVPNLSSHQDFQDIIYPGVGENYDFIIRFKNLHNKNIFNLVRDEDLFAWKFAKKGFFKFKENIPKINQRIFQNYSKHNF